MYSLGNKIALVLILMGVMGQELRAETSLETLGEMLFFETALSKEGSQSCSTCHDPSFGFVDPRDNGVNKMASLGDDGHSLGDRQAMPLAYAAFSPKFHRLENGTYKGGQFWDGRAATLADQAGMPPLNPIEMALPSKDVLLKRMKENADYKNSFEDIFGKDIWQDTDRFYQSLTKAIEAYEKTEEFMPFDSKYDRYLRGEVQLTPQEELGRVLFFSQQFTNCNVCHQLQQLPGMAEETFTNYEYHNIGVPENIKLRRKNGVVKKDDGLLANRDVNDAQERGKFKVPSLRNIAVTGPYMHNGVFKDLRTVVKFYNKYNSRSPLAQINPETKEEWGESEVADTISIEELKVGRALDTKRINALVAFMKTLTDARFEHLIK